MTVGYCRLNPGFPGCFPFHLDRPQETLLPALQALAPYLHQDKIDLRLTFWDRTTAEVCGQAGLRLNYELLKMHRKAEAGP